MSAIKHTAGPWEFESAKVPAKAELALGNDITIYAKRGQVASVSCERIAAYGNARLIAAAPRMLAIIEAVAEGVSVATARLLARNFLADLRKDSAP